MAYLNGEHIPFVFQQTGGGESGGGTVSNEDIAAAVNAYFEENPVKDGVDGVSPVITFLKKDYGYQMTVVDVNSTKVISLENGDDGKGIVSIDRTSGTGEAGTTDEYTITYTDNTTSTFTVYNGKDGASPKVTLTSNSTGVIIDVVNPDGTIASAKVNHGNDGSNGKDGTSVTVTNVSESTTDGGNNVVTFSDGKTVTIKNGTKGSKGDDGKTPVRGVDYWTASDIEEIKSYVDESILGGAW